MQEVDYIEEVEEEEEDEDGPPPGFHCIIAPKQQQQQQITHVPKTEVEEEDEDDDEDEGPPPGFDSLPSKKPQLLPCSSDTEKSSRQQEIDDDDDDIDDGPPPGWELSSLARALPKPLPNMTDAKTERSEELIEDVDEDEDEDEGPPPGWEMVLPHKKSLQCTPSLKPSSAVSSEIDMGSKQEIPKKEGDASHSVPQRSSPPPIPLLQKLPSSTPPAEIRIKEEEPKTGEKGPMPRKQSASPKPVLPPAPHPPTPAAAPSSSENAQLVCGTCRKLLWYPRGAKWVQCPGCQEVNFVLEAHEVGQVKCGGCTTLLMYPYGAPAVQCTSCRFVTEIGAHNARPPLSVQQAQAKARRQRRIRKVR